MSNRQQTLFRFMSLRAPESVVNYPEVQRKSFVLVPDNQSGVFFNAVGDREEGQTKWQALEKASTNFRAFEDVSEVEALSADFAAVSQWLAKNKSNFSTDELVDKINTYKLEPFNQTIESVLWNNLFYQVVAQKSFQVKELLCECLVLQNLLKEKGGNTEILKQLANANITLPPKLFVEDKIDIKTEEPREENPIFDSRLLVNSLQKTVAQSSTDRNKQAIVDLKKLQKKYRKEYNRLYQIAQSEYDIALKDAYSRATPVEKERINSVTGLKEMYLTYENLVLPEFKFEAPVEIDAHKLKTNLSEQSYSVLESLSLLESSTYNEIIDEINEVISDATQVLYKDITPNNKLLVIGGMVFEQNSANNHPLLKINEKPYAATLNWLSESTKKSEVLVALDLGSAGKIMMVSYKVTLDETTVITGNDFKVSSNGTIENLILFPNVGVDLSQYSNLELSLEVVLNTADKIAITTSIPLQGNVTGVVKMAAKASSAVEVTGIGPGTPAVTRYGVHRLGIADYRKVVAEVCCYKAAEVAHIENVMAREFRNKTTTRERIEETTISTETEQEIENLTDTTTTERFEMQSEVAKLLQEQKQLTAHANVTYNNGITSLDVGGSYANNTTKETSNKQALIQSKELTQRAMERIVTRFKQQTTKKITESFKEENAHIFDNRSSDKHVSGVYRYINAVYKNQIHNYGKRLMYEFMIPQPSKLYRMGMEVDTVSSPQTAPLEMPPTLESKGIAGISSITRETYATYASIYGAAVEAPPAEYITVGKAYQSNGGPDPKGGPYTKEYNDLKIPENYRLEGVNYQFSYRRLDDVSSNSNNINYHIVIGSASAITTVAANPTSQPSNGVSSDWNKGCPSIISSDVTFPNDMANYQDNIPVSIASWDLGPHTLVLNAKCALINEVYNTWQQNTYNAIKQAYQERLNEFYDKLNQTKQDAASFLTGNPLFYRQVEQTILKKNCVAYMVSEGNLGKGGFYTTNSTTNNALSFSNSKINQNEALDNYASMVKFMEQAFEWDMMSYSFYPYYWGDRNDWKQLFQSEDDDATFRNFMQAGMARVIVTVKPGFEEAAMYFMHTNKLWNGGQMPLIGDPLFLSIVEELKHQEYVVEETWETILPTSLVALQESGVAVKGEGLPCGDDCQEDGENLLIPNGSSMGTK